MEARMTQADDCWRLEEQFWLGGADFYERTLAPDALMVLPDPVGVLDRQATIASIRAGARWQGVVFRDRHVVCPGPDVAMLVYAAVAHRGADSANYAARCSSTYLRAAGQWQLVLHHQAPMQADDDGDA
jgi:hypothetical protein